MTKTEQLVIQAIIKRLQSPNCGCSHSGKAEGLALAANVQGLEVVSRVYLESWVIPALEMLLPGDGRNPELAKRLSVR